MADAFVHEGQLVDCLLVEATRGQKAHAKFAIELSRISGFIVILDFAQSSSHSKLDRGNTTKSEKTRARGDRKKMVNRKKTRNRKGNRKKKRRKKKMKKKSKKKSKREREERRIVAQINRSSNQLLTG